MQRLAAFLYTYLLSISCANRPNFNIDFLKTMFFYFGTSDSEATNSEFKLNKHNRNMG